MIFIDHELLERKAYIGGYVYDVEQGGGLGIQNIDIQNKWHMEKYFTKKYLKNYTLSKKINLLCFSTHLYTKLSAPLNIFVWYLIRNWQDEKIQHLLPPRSLRHVFGNWLMGLIIIGVSIFLSPWMEVYK
ncbi:hypothetical protein ACJX0J_024397 [Zea mays]